MVILFIFSLTDQVNGKDWVRPRRVLIQLVGALVPVLDTLVEDRYQILDTGALYHHEIFDEKPIFSIPSGVQDTWCRVK